jgi:hypothetical protein
LTEQEVALAALHWFESLKFNQRDRVVTPARGGQFAKDPSSVRQRPPCRVTLGGCPPRVPTDPDGRIGATGEWGVTVSDENHLSHTLAYRGRRKRRAGFPREPLRTKPIPADKEESRPRVRANRLLRRGKGEKTGRAAEAIPFYPSVHVGESFQSGHVNLNGWNRQWQRRPCPRRRFYARRRGCVPILIQC